MSTPHFFVEDRISGSVGTEVELALPQALLNHLHTLRLKAGENIVLVDAPGHGWELQLCAAVSKRSLGISALLKRELCAERATNVTLVQGISAAERMDQTVRQCTELGVSGIIPLMSERSTVRLNSATRTAKQQRWQRVAQSAAEQSGQLRLPNISSAMPLSEVLSELSGYDLLLFFWEECGGRAVAEAIGRLGARAPQVAIFIGPEGGFSEAEAEAIMQAGAVQVSLGDTILRTETAAVVATALTLYHLGALQDHEPALVPGSATSSCVAVSSVTTSPSAAASAASRRAASPKK